MKHRINEETGLVCSIGLAPNKLLAKIASDLDKPDGFCVLTPERCWMRWARGRRRCSPASGPKTFERLRRAGIRTVADLAGARTRRSAARAWARSCATARAGSTTGAWRPTRQRKSESCETTFAEDVSDREVMLATLDRLAARLCEGLQRGGYRGRTVTLKIRLRPFRTYTRSRTLESPTREVEVVRGVAHELLGRVEIDTPVRLLGVGISGLERAAADDTRLFAEA